VTLAWEERPTQKLAAKLVDELRRSLGSTHSLVARGNLVGASLHRGNAALGLLRLGRGLH
jgi:hypothetical protein